jgi:ribonucleoside-diphosphate reductase alpha chain
MFWRVATVVGRGRPALRRERALVRAVAEEFYALMTERRFEPNSPTLMNAGARSGSSPPCFVLPVEDALSNGQNGIYDTLRSMALIHQSGGGTGFSFSRLRPKGSMVRSTTGVASGPVSFMKLYDASTDAVKQGGTRRGANMGILRVDHPDVMDFIACKEDLTQITNFNISVGVTRKFMDALRANESYDLVDPTTGLVTGQLAAREVWDKMVLGAWRTGEPGVFFIDEANRYNPVPHLGAYEATNPCGEQPLLAVRRLQPRLDQRRLLRRRRRDGLGGVPARRARVHALPRQHHRRQQVPAPGDRRPRKRIRRIGLGVMGFADALIKLGIAYDTPEGVEFGRRVMEFLDVEGRRRASAWPTRAARSPSGRAPSGAPTPPARATSAASASAPCSSSATATSPPSRPPARSRSSPAARRARAALRGRVHAQPGGRDDARRERGLRRDRAARGLVLRGADGAHREDGHGAAPRGARSAGSASSSPRTTSRPSGTCACRRPSRQHCDSAISKTTNFSHARPIEDVQAIYELAYDLNCKGVTVYRDGSRDGQVLSTGATEQAKKEREKAAAGAAAGAGATAANAARDAEAKREVGELRGTLAEKEAELERLKKQLYESEAENLQRRMKRSRPDMLRGTTRRMETPLGTMYVNITEDEKGQPFEVFLNLGKAGGAAMADAEAMGRLISMAMRSGIPIMDIHRQLRGIASDKAIGLGPNKVLSVPDAIGIAIEQWWRDKQGVQQELLGGRRAALGSRLRPATPVASNSGTGQMEQYSFDSYDNGSRSWAPAPTAAVSSSTPRGCVKCHVCGFSECG